MNSTDGEFAAQPAPAPVRRGRRRGETATRTAIAHAARRRFAAGGYDRATIRAIASDAQVDPALVLHFFGSKRQLFLDVMSLPFDPAQAFACIFAGRRASVGHRFAQFALGVLESPEGRSIVTGIVRAAATEPQAAELVRELVSGQISRPLAEQIRIGDAELRANLVGSQIVGVVMARYVVRVEPLASAPPDTVVGALGPTLQRYLARPL